MDPSAIRKIFRTENGNAKAALMEYFSALPASTNFVKYLNDFSIWCYKRDNQRLVPTEMRPCESGFKDLERFLIRRDLEQASSRGVGTGGRKDYFLKNIDGYCIGREDVIQIAAGVDAASNWTKPVPVVEDRLGGGGDGASEDSSGSVEDEGEIGTWNAGGEDGEPGGMRPLSADQFSDNDFFDEGDLRALLAARAKRLIAKDDAATARAVRQSFEEILRNSRLSVLPPSHEWSDLDKRLQFFKYYTLLIREGENIGTDELVESIVAWELNYEKDGTTGRDVYDQLVDEGFGKKYVPHPRPAPEPEPEMDPDTKAIIERRKVKELTNAYLQSFGKDQASTDKALGDLIVAYCLVISDLSIPLEGEFQDQEERAKKHWILEWMQANEFPSQHRQLFDTLDQLLNNARKFVRNKENDNALQQMDVAETLLGYLSELLNKYYSGKVRKGTRVLIVLMVLKNVARAIVSLLIFKNVQGAVSQLAALFVANLATQAYDRGIGLRDKGVNAREAGVDAGLEFLTAKISMKVSELWVSKLGLNPKALSTELLNTITSDVIGSMINELRNLGNGATFSGFLIKIKNRLADPQKWAEDLAVVAISRNYSTTAKVNPMGYVPYKKVALASAFVLPLALAPKTAGADAGSGKPVASLADTGGTGSLTSQRGLPPKSDGASTVTATAPADNVVSTTQANQSSPSTATPGEPSAAVQNIRLGTDTGRPTTIQRGIRADADAGMRSKKPPKPPPSKLPAGVAAGVVATQKRRGKYDKLLAALRERLKLLPDDDTKKEILKRVDEIEKGRDSGAIKPRDAIKRLQAALNNVNENIAVLEVDNLFQSNDHFFGYKKIIGKVVVPRRGKKGPEILDVAYEVEADDPNQPGKTIRKFIIFEVKYGSSRLAKGQFSRSWFKARIAEIRAKDPALAQRLEDAWTSRNVESYLMKIRASGNVSAYGYTGKWNRGN